MQALARQDVLDGSAITRKPAVQSIELEDLRNKALNSNESVVGQTAEIEQLLQSTSRIHAAFLFHSPKTLQPLLRAIGETNNGAIESGWQMFGDKLGLDVTILKVINNNQFNHEDPVYNTLLHYVQYEDATIGKIVRALVDMGRFDVITRSKDVLNQLADAILGHERDLLISSQTRLQNSPNFGTSEDLTLPNDVLIKPALIPDAPFIIKNVQAAPLLSTLLLQNVASSRANVICSPSFSQALAIEASPEILVRASPVPGPLSPSQRVVANAQNGQAKQPYTRKVMLTFAADGAAIANQIARILRQPRGTTRIGVLILSEQNAHLQADPNLFITASYQMVDYVLPILTEGYLRSVLKKSWDEMTDSSCVDPRYVPFIYQVMMQDYSRKGCLNNKVRCIIPDQQLDAVLGHLMMASPLFSAWERSSKIENLAERILASNA